MSLLDKEDTQELPPKLNEAEENILDALAENKRLKEENAKLKKDVGQSGNSLLITEDREGYRISSSKSSFVFPNGDRIDAPEGVIFVDDINVAFAGDAKEHIKYLDEQVQSNRTHIVKYDGKIYRNDDSLEAAGLK